ncbi:hypothetical protein BST61_g5399 [Cercospora zeina]
MKWEDVRLYVDEALNEQHCSDYPSLLNVRAEIDKHFSKGNKDQEKTFTTWYGRPLALDSHVCPISLLLVHALRHGLVKGGTTLKQVLQYAAARSDKHSIRCKICIDVTDDQIDPADLLPPDSGGLYAAEPDVNGEMESVEGGLFRDMTSGRLLQKCTKGPKTKRENEKRATHGLPPLQAVKYFNSASNEEKAEAMIEKREKRKTNKSEDNEDSFPSSARSLLHPVPISSPSCCIELHQNSKDIINAGRGFRGALPPLSRALRALRSFIAE